MATPVSGSVVEAISKSVHVYVSLAVLGPTLGIVYGFEPSAKSIVRLNRFKVNA